MQEARFTVLGNREKLKFHGQISITRAPWPFFDVKGGGIELGDRVVLSSGCHILTHSHQFYKSNWRDLDEVRPENPTIIEDDAFIGINAIIMPTCKRVGVGSVIGAGSVVTRDVPDYEIWAGNPAIRIGGVDEQTE